VDAGIVAAGELDSSAPTLLLIVEAIMSSLQSVPARRERVDIAVSLRRFGSDRVWELPSEPVGCKNLIG
jgi:hypothetical protein